MSFDRITIRGAREHNLKNVDIDIPRGRLVILTGVSGSGKSSLAFDTLFAEGQRRFVESLSAYARQFLPQMNKPDVDLIEGLSPAISIEQKTTHRNPRSTVGTVTEIYDYLRLLFARIGMPHCFRLQSPIAGQTPTQMIEQILELPQGTRFQLLSPLVRGRKGEYRKELEQIRKEGYTRLRIDGVWLENTEEIQLDKKKKHDIDVVIDRLSIRPDVRTRLADSVEMSLKKGAGLLKVVIQPAEGKDPEEWLLSEHHACLLCGMSWPEIAPQMFSFNSPQGACPTCAGIGFEEYVDPDLVIPNPQLSITQGAIAFWGRSKDSQMGKLFEEICRLFGEDPDHPWAELSDDLRSLLLHGTGRAQLKGASTEIRRKLRWFDGILPMLDRFYRETGSEERQEQIGQYTRQRPCETCRGTRLRKDSLHVLVGGLDIAAVTKMSIREALDFFTRLPLRPRDEEIASRLLKEIRQRLRFLVDVGLDYLTLDRTAGTLSGGEAQRIRLATQIGSALTGVLYVLDEPSIGLHPRDNSRLLHTLRNLRDLGNTVLVVEHDEETMMSADYLIDMGPGAGVHGGEIVSHGSVAHVMQDPKSLTGLYLSGQKFIPIPASRRPGKDGVISIRGAYHNNLKHVSVDLPLGRLLCVTGVSGSGKSSLIIDTLYRYAALHLHGSRGRLGEVERIDGLDAIDKVINIDQSPIGRTPRSNPATYVEIFTPIRDLFSQLSESKTRGYSPGRFSFNVKGGRCEVCEGAGILRIEMHFLPDVFVTCETCKGKRFNRETLEIRYKGRNISEILDMTVEEALPFFEAIPVLRRRLQTLFDVGLGYIALGQAATTLSGGEAQRIKLAKELSRRSTGRTLYILDEPTTGLHFEDIQKLLVILHRLADEGNTVIVIEHQLDVIKAADWILDMGPEGGARGGEVLTFGSPEAVALHPTSHTARFLHPILFPSPKPPEATNLPLSSKPSEAADLLPLSQPSEATDLLPLSQPSEATDLLLSSKPSEATDLLPLSQPSEATDLLPLSQPSVTATFPPKLPLSSEPPSLDLPSEAPKDSLFEPPLSAARPLFVQEDAAAYGGPPLRGIDLKRATLSRLDFAFVPNKGRSKEAEKEPLCFSPVDRSGPSDEDAPPSVENDPTDALTEIPAPPPKKKRGRVGAPAQGEKSKA